MYVGKLIASHPLEAIQCKPVTAADVNLTNKTLKTSNGINVNVENINVLIP